MDSVTHVVVSFSPSLKVSGQNDGSTEDEGDANDGGGHQARDPHRRVHPFLVKLQTKPEKKKKRKDVNQWPSNNYRLSNDAVHFRGGSLSRLDGLRIDDN